MRKRITLLTTCSGGSLMPCVLIELSKSEVFDYRFIGIDINAPVSTACLLNRFYAVPAGDNPDYIPILLDIIKQEKVDVILPLSDSEAYAISSAADEIESLGAKAVVSPKVCLDLISDKFSTYQNVEKAGLAAPEYMLVRDGEELSDALNHYDYPNETIVLKPKKGRGNRGIHILCGKEKPPKWLGSGKREKRIEVPVNDPEQLVSFMEGETLVMPCLGLPAYDVDVLNHDVGQYAVFIRERLNPTGIPFDGNRVTVDPSISDYCKKVAQSLNLEALHDMDLMTDSSGNPVILEVNPRPSGSVATMLVAGFPVIDWAVARSLKMDVIPYEPDEDIEVSALNSIFAVPNR